MDEEEDKIRCPQCGEWFDADDGTDDGFCSQECADESTQDEIDNNNHIRWESHQSRFI